MRGYTKDCDGILVESSRFVPEQQKNVLAANLLNEAAPDNLRIEGLATSAFEAIV